MFSENLNNLQTFRSSDMHLKMSSIKYRSLCWGLDDAKPATG